MGRRRSRLITPASTPRGAAHRCALYGVAVVLILLSCDVAAIALRQERASGALAGAPVVAATAISSAVVPSSAIESLAATPPTYVPPQSSPVPPAAPPPTEIASDASAADRSPGWEQRRGAKALGLITYPWQQLGYSISFVGSRPGLLGGTIPERHQILLFVRPDEDVNLLASVIAHELGHAVDKTYNNDDRRRSWLEARGLPATTRWFTCNMCPDFATGSGDFAEAFVAWQTGRAYYRGQLAPAPSDAQLATLRGFFQP